MMDNTSVALPATPSWLRWPPNCCETCTGWRKTGDYVGKCEQGASINSGDVTDSRMRCPDFTRKGETPH